MSDVSSATADASPETCDVCGRPRAVCVCDRIVPHDTARRVLILQHPREKDEILGSAQILTASLPKAQIAVGLSWRNLRHALGREKGEQAASVGSWAVLFPDRQVSDRQQPERQAPATRVEKRGGGGDVDPATLDGLVVLDGTWSQAKSLWWRNPWLLRLHRMTLEPKEPSIYGKLRAEPSRRHVSTLESVAAALTACGEKPEIEKELRRVFRTLVQRCRDARLK